MALSVERQASGTLQPHRQAGHAGHGIDGIDVYAVADQSTLWRGTL